MVCPPPPRFLAGSRTARHHPPGHTEQQQSAASPSSPVSTAGDSRSSKRTSLPPCQQKLLPLLAVLVHSTDAGESLAVTTKHWRRPSRPERRSCRGREERESTAHAFAAELISESMSLLPALPPPSLPSSSLTFCYDLIASCLAPPPSPLLHTRQPASWTTHTPPPPPPPGVFSKFLTPPLPTRCSQSCRHILRRESEQRGSFRPDSSDIMTGNLFFLSELVSASSLHVLQTVANI